MTNRSIDDIRADMLASNDALHSARERENVARSEAINHLNNLNAFQREFDEAIARMKKESAKDSNWHQSMRGK